MPTPLARLRPWLKRTRSTGRRGERAAARFLKTQGYRICGRNLRNRFGEIDLLAQTPDQKTMVIVEVKAGRRNAAFAPEVHVTRDKQHRLVALAAQCARRYRLTRCPWRFDVVAVEFPTNSGKPTIRHHRNAFESPY